MLDQHADEALERAEDGAVDHDRPLGLPVAVDVLEPEAIRLLEVDLDGRHLPAPSERVLHVDVDLRSIERPVARVELEREAVGAEGILQRPLGRLPLLVRSERLLGPRRQLEERLEHEGLVPLADQLEQRGDLVLDLIQPAVDVGVVLRELPHAHEAGQRPRPLVAMQTPHVREAQGQIAVRAQRVAIDQRGFRAVHRLEAEDLLLGLHQEHVLAVVLPVAGLLPEPLVDQDRRGDLLIAPRVENLADEPLELTHERPAVREPEGRARRDVVKGVEVELAPELAVVALLRLLEPPQMLVELLLREPRGAVDALEHRVALVAPPVGAGGREELEVLHVRGRGHVRPAAEVDEVALPVERDARRRDPFEDLHLERLTALAEEADRFLTRHLLPLERIRGLRDLPHDLFDLHEVFRCERLGFREVVVEAVLDRRTDRDAHGREQTLHRLSHDVRGRMTQRRERRGIAVEVAGQLEVTIFFRQWCARQSG